MSVRAPVYTRIVLRLAVSLAVATFVLAAACGGGDSTSSPTAPSGDGSTVVPVPTVQKPVGVPEAAVAVETTTTLGTIERRANADPVTNDTRTLDGASCANNVAIFRTDRETIYAVFPTGGGGLCDRFWDAATRELFAGQELAIVLEVTPERLRMLFETVAGAQGEFSFAGIWVE